jgi:hypothetical protein
MGVPWAEVAQGGQKFVNGLFTLYQSAQLARAVGSSSRALQEGGRAAQGILGRQQGVTRGDFAPYREAGAESMDALRAALTGGEFEAPSMDEVMQDPGVAYRMERANEALQKSAAARGRLMSGGTIRNVAELNQALASQEYGNAYARTERERDRKFRNLFSVSQLGEQAAGTEGQFGLQYAMGLGGLETDIASAKAAGILGVEKAMQTGRKGLFEGSGGGGGGGSKFNLGSFFDGDGEGGTSTGEAKEGGFG